MYLLVALCVALVACFGFLAGGHMLDRRGGSTGSSDKVDACHMQSKEETTSCLGKKSPSKAGVGKSSESTFDDFDDDGPSVDDIIGELHRNTSYMAISHQLNQLQTGAPSNGTCSSNQKTLMSGGTLARNYATINANYGASTLSAIAHLNAQQQPPTDAQLVSQGIAGYSVDGQNSLQSIVATSDPNQMQFRTSTYGSYPAPANYEPYALYTGAGTMQSPHHIGLANYPPQTTYSYATDSSGVSPQHILLTSAPSAQGTANQLLLRPMSTMMPNAASNGHASSTFQPLSIHLLTAGTASASPVRASPAALSNHAVSPNVSYADTCSAQSLPQPPLPSPHVNLHGPPSIGGNCSSMMNIPNCGQPTGYGAPMDGTRAPTLLMSAASQAQNKPIDSNDRSLLNSILSPVTLQLTSGHCANNIDGTNLSSSSSSNSAISSHTASTVLSHMSHGASINHMGTLKRSHPPPDTNCPAPALNTYF
jgi:hypothetical protein